MFSVYSQGRMLVNYVVKLHAEYHSEQLRKGFEGLYVMYCLHDVFERPK